MRLYLLVLFGTLYASSIVVNVEGQSISNVDLPPDGIRYDPIQQIVYDRGSGGIRQRRDP